MSTAFPPNSPAVYTSPRGQISQVIIVTGRPRRDDGWLLIRRDSDGGLAWAEPGRLVAIAVKQENRRAEA